MTQEHIKVKRYESKGFQIGLKCLHCEELNFISDFADDKRKKENETWFTNRHRQCGREYKGE